MLAYLSEPFLNMAIPFVAILFGFVYSMGTFIGVVLIEARIMNDYFLFFSQPKRVRLALITNVVSSLVGIPLVFLASQVPSLPRSLSAGLASISMGYYTYMMVPLSIFQSAGWLVYAFLLTVIIESITLLILLKPDFQFKYVISYTLAANLASYAVLLLLPMVLWILLGGASILLP